jgi:hypothetical protein
VFEEAGKVAFPTDMEINPAFSAFLVGSDKVMRLMRSPVFCTDGSILASKSAPNTPAAGVAPPSKSPVAKPPPIKSTALGAGAKKSSKGAGVWS